MSLLFIWNFFLVSFLFYMFARSEDPRPTFAFSWLKDNDTFTAGDTATVKVKVFADNLDVFARTPLNLTIAVNGKVGNSTYVSGVSSSFAGDPESWFISFMPISAGVFSVIIADDGYKVLDSSLHFQAIAGRIETAACLASWMGLVSDFEAGVTATVLILPRDSFGNNVSSTAEEAALYGFHVSAFYVNGSMASLFNVSHMGWNLFGYFSVEFIVIKAGDFLLHVEGGNQTLDGSPLGFKVYPGPLDVSSCAAEWSLGTNVLQIFSKMELFIHQNDRYSNVVQGWYAFDAQVVEKGTNLSIPVPDLIFEEVVPGIQLLSSSLLEPGDFMLTIYNLEHNTSISGMPFEFTVYVGYCDGANSVINGSGLDSSIAGEVEKFSVYLKDKYQYPSPVELNIIRVQILRETDFLPVWPTIVPLETVNGSVSLRSSAHGTVSPTGLEPASAPSTHHNNSSGGNEALQATSFEVTFKPEKSGLYGIHVFCGNIPLNGGHHLTKEVISGEVDISQSGVVQFESKVSKLRKIEILVQLMDFYLNPIKAQESKLKLDIGSVNGSKSETWIFIDNGNGSYSGFYMVKDASTYELCVSFDGKQLQPCPFQVNVYGGEYFPRATSDQVPVWEDESVAFDVISNDYFAGGNVSIVNTSKPAHGTLLQYGKLFRYTPFKGFSGNDSFVYTISDVNDNVAVGSVNISVLIIPPQFVSLPELLCATEDTINPKFGGFPGFEIKYSDQNENISVTLHAMSGFLFLSPMLMQFGNPMWTGLLLSTGDGTATDLTLMGNVEAVNIALQSIQYLGDGNFSGEDTIQLSTRNKNGINDVKVPVLVEPVNDPPFIQVPDYIILKQVSNATRIFVNDSNKLEFIIGDPDVLNFPGGESQFLVAFSVEVSTGFLETKLPAELINTTELKLRRNFHWQPLLNFVTISEHFTVKAKGVRFRGTFPHCREIMQQLSYHGGDHAAILTLTLNDLGNYGCYQDCVEKLSEPLFSEATIKLVRRKPMSSLAARSLGSVIICEFITVCFLGAVLLFYTCKCARALANERSSSLSTQTSSPDHSPLQVSTSCVTAVKSDTIASAF
uniref:GEX2 N-terminal Ig-like domain-containing protein n=1 Tax=Kalanchoe fedtschenkoi TaxID=63787 RepID=A0A7N0UQ31_KALFE